MAEDETGFTFVDKRRTAVSETAEEAVQDTPEDAQEAPLVDQSPDDFEDGAADAAVPEIYALLDYSIRLFATTAWHNLGLLADPQTGEAKTNLPQAKIAIDVVGDLIGRLESAPEDIVPANARREMKNLVNDLRLNYVAQRDQSAKN